VTALAQVRDWLEATLTNCKDNNASVWIPLHKWLEQLEDDGGD
jgi:hypothetical protein